MKALKTAARRLSLDPMEQRILLSADVLALDLATLSPEQRDHDILVRMVDEVAGAQSGAATIKRIEVVDRQGNRVLAFGDASTIGAVSILGGAGADRLTVDAVSFDGSAPVVSFDGRGGMDRLVFLTERDATWTVENDNAGRVSDGQVSATFTSVETLEGAADNNDTFILLNDAWLDGGVVGGDRGFDILETEGTQIGDFVYQVAGPDSGTLIRDGRALFFDGLEPIVINPSSGNVLIDLRDGDQTATLSTTSGGRFLLSGSGFEEIEFTATNSIRILGGEGFDSVTVAGFLPGYTGSLHIEAETITVNAGVSIGAAANRLSSVSLIADAGALSTGSGNVTATAALDVRGAINASGLVTLAATAGAESRNPGGAAGNPLLAGGVNVTGSATATATVHGSAVINAGAFLLEAATDLTLSQTRTQALAAGITLDAATVTRAEIVNGARLAVGSVGIGVDDLSTLVRATDTITLNADLSEGAAAQIVAAAASLGGLTGDGFSVLVNEIDLSRDTQALIGAATITSGGAMAVRAANDGSVSNRVNSGLVGVTLTDVRQDRVLARVTGAVLQAAALGVEARNGTVFESRSKVATNSLVGSTTARIDAAAVSATGPGGVSVLAHDIVRYTVRSADFNLNAAISPISMAFGVAAGVNKVAKPVTAAIEGGTVRADAGPVSVRALSDMRLEAVSEALVVTGPGVNFDARNFSFGGTMASNELRGDVTALIRNADVTATGAMGDVVVEARSGATIDALTQATTQVTGGENAAVGIAVAINFLGLNVANVAGALLDALVGATLGATQDSQDVVASIEGGRVNAGRDVRVAAEADGLVNATTSNAAKSAAGGDPFFDKAGLGAAGILASNRLVAATRATVRDVEMLAAGGDVDVTAKNAATINSNIRLVASSITTNDGGLTQLETAISSALPFDFETDGVTDQTVNLSFGQRVRLTGDYEEVRGAGTPASIYRFMGASATGVNLATTDFTDLDLWAEAPETNILPTGANITKSSSVAIGITIARNELTTSTTAEVVASTLGAGGDIAVRAEEAATILAEADSGVESSGGSSITGEGTSLAVNGLIAFNTVRNKASAIVSGSDLTAGGAIGVEALNSGLLDATVHMATTSAGDGVGVVLAFNTVGYAPTNLGFQVLDAILGTSFGPADPSVVLAEVSDSTLTAGGAITVTAENAATLKALIDTQATSFSAAAQGASAMSASGVLASNMVAAGARAALIDTNPANGRMAVNGAALTVEAREAATLISETLLVTGARRVNDLGTGLINSLAQALLDSYGYTTRSGSHALKFGERVRVASDFTGSGEAGRVYQFMGADMASAVDLATVNYSDLDLWKPLDETNVIPSGIASALVKGFGLDNGSAKSYAVLVSRNDLEGGAEAVVENVAVDVTGDVAVRADAAAVMVANEASQVSGGNSIGGILANNQLLGSATARITDSTVRAGGDVRVEAFNLAQLTARTLTEMTVAGDGVSVVIAMNAVGFDASNMVFQLIDALLGSDYLIEAKPVSASAYIENTVVEAGGAVSVTAESREVLFSLDEEFAQKLDDAAIEDVDDADAALDAEYLEAIRAALEAGGLEVEGGVTVRMLAPDAFWYVTDESGRSWQIRRVGTSLEVANVNIVDAVVGNEVASNARNDRVLVDRLFEQDRIARSEKPDQKLKYGANGMAAGGTLAANRINSETRAFIRAATHDFLTTDIAPELDRGDRVKFGDRIFEYVGAPQLIERAFEYATKTVIEGILRDPSEPVGPASLETGDRIRLGQDVGAFSSGDILRYTGPRRTAADPEVGIDLAALVAAQPTQFVKINAPRNVVLTNAVQSYATSANWREVAAQGAGTITAGGGVAVQAADSANIIADISLGLTSVVTNNLDAFKQLAVNLAERDYDFTTRSGVQTLTGGERVRIGAGFAGTVDGGPAQRGKVYQYLGGAPLTADLNTLVISTASGLWRDVTAQENLIEDLFPNFGNLAESNSRAVGGMIVVNDARGRVVSFIEQVTVTAGGDVTVTADAATTILASLLSNVSSSGGSAWGTGTSLAVNAQIATNKVLSTAEAAIRDATVNADGSVRVEAVNAAILDARLSPSTDSGDTAVSVSLAFNSIGWRATNILFEAIDAFLGDPLISERAFNGEAPALARATIKNSSIDADGDITVAATSAELLNATLSNATVSAASALKDASGKSIGVALASNKVSARAEALVDDSDLTAGGDIVIEADDDLRMFSNAKLVSESSTSNDGGASVLQETLNAVVPVDWVASNRANVVDLRFGDLVRTSRDWEGPGGDPLTVYVYLGNPVDGAGVDLSGVDFSDTDFWKPHSVTSIVPEGLNFSDSDSTGVSALMIYNEVRGGAEARATGGALDAGGEIKIAATENALLVATTDSVASSDGGDAFGEGDSTTVSGVVATNLLLATARAFARDADLTAGGDVTVEAANTAAMIATTGAVADTAGTGVGVTVALNSMGWAPSSTFIQLLDALLGDPLLSNAYNGERPVMAEAWIEDTPVEAGGDLVVRAVNDATVIATTTNETTSIAVTLKDTGGAAVGAVVALNRVSAGARAEILGAGTVDAASVLVEADDTAAIDATNTLELYTLAVGDAGIGLVLGKIDELINEYAFTTKSGRQFVFNGQKVLAASDIGARGTAGELYLYIGASGFVDFGTTNLNDASLWRRVDPVNLESLIPPGINLNIGDADATAAGGMVAVNDVRARVRATIADTTVRSSGDVTVTATERAGIEVLNEGYSKADGGSFFKGGSTTLAISGIIATNLVQAEAQATISNSTVQADGSVLVGAYNDARILSTVDVEVIAEGGGTSIGIGVALAFNSIGIESQNFLFNAADAFLGAIGVDATIANTKPVLARALITGGSVTADAVEVEAETSMTIEAVIANAALATSVSLKDNTTVTVAPIIALNRGAAKAEALIGGAASITARTGDVRVEATDISQIDADARSSAISASVGVGKGKAIGVAAVIVRNEIASDVTARISGTAAAATSVTARLGVIDVLARQEARIDAVAAAAAVSFSASANGSLTVSGGGVLAGNAILGSTRAQVADAVLTALGVNVHAESTAEITARVVAVAASASLAADKGTAVAVGIAVVDNSIGWARAGVAHQLTSDQTGVRSVAPGQIVR
ncbi:MAG: LEPR-XLL domain-containing protein, partial [Rhodobacteraceae bacterium]